MNYYTELFHSGFITENVDTRNHVVLLPQHCTSVCDMALVIDSEQFHSILQKARSDNPMNEALLLSLHDAIQNEEFSLFQIFTDDPSLMEIYKEKLPYVDVVLYIIQADDGAIKEDERIIKDIISNCGKNIKKKFAIGINKVDLLGNGKNMEWREDLNLPSEEQEELIEKKGKEII